MSMNDFGYRKAQEQYDNALPDRDNRKIAFYCDCCDEPIFEGDTFIHIDFEDCSYCNICAEVCTAEREVFE